MGVDQLCRGSLPDFDVLWIKINYFHTNNPLALHHPPLTHHAHPQTPSLPPMTQNYDHNLQNYPHPLNPNIPLQNSPPQHHKNEYDGNHLYFL